MERVCLSCMLDQPHLDRSDSLETDVYFQDTSPLKSLHQFRHPRYIDERYHDSSRSERVRGGVPLSATRGTVVFEEEILYKDRVRAREKAKAKASRASAEVVAIDKQEVLVLQW